MQFSSKSNPNTGETRKSLSSVLPEGQLVDRNWLNSHGFNRPLVDYYLRSGGLEAVARGVYRRPGPPLKWQHVVYSLQEMGYLVHVGGRTALDHQGMAHYLPMGQEVIHLYSDNKLPAWLNLVVSNTAFESHYRSLFLTDDEGPGFTSLPFGAWDWLLHYATRERALLEYVDDLPGKAELDVADKYMESATSFRPGLVMALLKACTRVKTRRLFLWLADRHRPAWFNKLNVSAIDLGSGKRVIYKGGKLNTRYQITVPVDYADGEELNGTRQPLF
ncbi:MAG: type IV toxin-antitoxin system AbiEi family antitoxin domain-containing protein [Gammaproteobacteria bacterium]